MNPSLTARIALVAASFFGTLLLLVAFAVIG